jgi:hypothetical protein
MGEAVVSAAGQTGRETSYARGLDYPHSTLLYSSSIRSAQQDFFPLYLILPHPSILYIILYPLYSLWDPLITLSKYIHV